MDLRNLVESDTGRLVEIGNKQERSQAELPGIQV